jgi:hypothetical protein
MQCSVQDSKGCARIEKKASRCSELFGQCCFFLDQALRHLLLPRQIQDQHITNTDRVNRKPNPIKPSLASV